MASNHSSQRLEVPRSKRRYKAAIACTNCRRRKLKCDSVQPTCGRCQSSPKLRFICTYVPVSESNGNLKSPNDPAQSPHIGAPFSETPSLPHKSDLSQNNRQHGNDGGDNFGDGDSKEFLFQVQTTIDEKLGLPLRKERCPVPLTDAAMFGSFLTDQSFTESSVLTDNMLPQRRHSDDLVDLYWGVLEPLEPLLDRRRFFLNYEALFSGTQLVYEEHTFISILNVVFALATQLQESTFAEHRDEVSKKFFLRAWSSLGPTTSIWNAPSIELVQCLLLLARYLQCTTALHQTWMAIGSAVRIAQSLRLHLPGNTVAISNEEAVMKKEVWNQCVSMDRSLSWSLGRIPMATLPHPVTSATSGSGNIIHGEHAASVCLLAKTAELNDITSRITLLQANARSASAESFDSLQLSQLTDFDATAQIDQRLGKLTESLLSSTSQSAQENNNQMEMAGRRVLLRLRIIHARMTLFRPMLIRFCLVQSKAPIGSSSSASSFEDHLIQSCARVCVEGAIELITLVDKGSRLRLIDNESPKPSVGSRCPPPRLSVLPWWYRVFYLHVACQHLVAAMLRPDVFAPTVTESWTSVTAALQAHEYISPCVKRCLRAYERLWTNVMEINCPFGATGANQEDQTGDSIQGQDTLQMDQFLQDVLQGFDFEPEAMHNLNRWDMLDLDI